MALINNLEKYLKLNYNVMLVGRHGVGKTMIIKQLFENAGMRWKYFSASTLDPWVDFVGIPKEADDGSLQLVRPSFIAHDEVDALFFDELNRAPEKVLNAIMELLQFKSINGHKLNNLKVIWAAINPEDEEGTYSVSHLDPAHIDRFHVKIEVPYKVDETYFSQKYRETGPKFVAWWNQLPDEIKLQISPRRLDYAADAYSNDCRLEDFLPHKSNIPLLRKMLRTRSFSEEVAKISSVKEAEEFLSDINNSTMMFDLVKQKDNVAAAFFNKYVSVLPKEIVAPFKELVSSMKYQDTIVDLESMVFALPDTEGDAVTAAIINNARFLQDPSYNVEPDVKWLISNRTSLFTKLFTKYKECMLRCSKEQLKRCLYLQTDNLKPVDSPFFILFKATKSAIQSISSSSITSGAIPDSSFIDNEFKTIISRLNQLGLVEPYSI